MGSINFNKFDNHEELVLAIGYFGLELFMAMKRFE